jgi:hypothetical protein
MSKCYLCGGSLQGRDSVMVKYGWVCSRCVKELVEATRGGTNLGVHGGNQITGHCCSTVYNK